MSCSAVALSSNDYLLNYLERCIVDRCTFARALVQEDQVNALAWPESLRDPDHDAEFLRDFVFDKGSRPSEKLTATNERCWNGSTAVDTDVLYADPLVMLLRESLEKAGFSSDFDKALGALRDKYRALDAADAAALPKMVARQKAWFNKRVNPLKNMKELRDAEAGSRSVIEREEKCLRRRMYEAFKVGQVALKHAESRGAYRGRDTPVNRERQLQAVAQQQYLLKIETSRRQNIIEAAAAGYAAFMDAEEAAQSVFAAERARRLADRRSLAKLENSTRTQIFRLWKREALIMYAKFVERVVSAQLAGLVATETAHRAAIVAVADLGLRELRTSSRRKGMSLLIARRQVEEAEVAALLSQEAAARAFIIASADNTRTALGSRNTILIHDCPSGCSSLSVSQVEVEHGTNQHHHTTLLETILAMHMDTVVSTKEPECRCALVAQEQHEWQALQMERTARMVKLRAAASSARQQLAVQARHGGSCFIGCSARELSRRELRSNKFNIFHSRPPPHTHSSTFIEQHGNNNDNVDASPSSITTTTTNITPVLSSSVPPVMLEVDALHKGGPAHRAGLQLGDGIMAVQGKHIRSVSDMRAVLEQCHVGDVISVTICRADQFSSAMSGGGGGYSGGAYAQGRDYYRDASRGGQRLFSMFSTADSSMVSTASSESGSDAAADSFYPRHQHQKHGSTNSSHHPPELSACQMDNWTSPTSIFMTLSVGVQTTDLEFSSLVPKPDDDYGLYFDVEVAERLEAVPIPTGTSVSSQRYSKRRQPPIAVPAPASSSPSDPQRTTSSLTLSPPLSQKKLVGPDQHSGQRQRHPLHRGPLSPSPSLSTSTLSHSSSVSFSASSQKKIRGAGDGDALLERTPLTNLSLNEAARHSQTTPRMQTSTANKNMMMRQQQYTPDDCSIRLWK